MKSITGEKQKSNPMRAYCGLNCAACETFLASHPQDPKAQARVARNWNKKGWGKNLKAPDINCDGCRSGSATLFKTCGACEIRCCAKDKGYDNCAHCYNFPCDRVNVILDHAPQARALLEALHRKLRQ